EEAIADARALSIRINTWESRWPLNTYRNRDAGKLSRAMLARLAQAEAMSLDDYRADLDEGIRVRALYESLAAQCDACDAGGPGGCAGRPWLDWRSGVCSTILTARRAGNFIAAAARARSAVRASSDRIPREGRNHLRDRWMGGKTLQRMTREEVMLTAIKGCQWILAATVLAGLVIAPANAEDLKLWRHGIVEAKSDAGIVFMGSKGGFAE